MENLFFLALVAVVGLIRWLMQSAEHKKNEQAAQRNQPASAPIPRAPVKTEEERIRRFMEALGVPKGESPPRRVTPRAQKTILPVDPFPTPRTAAAGLPPVVAQMPTTLPIPQTSMLAEPTRPVPVLVATEVVTPARDATTSLAARLSNADGLRDAIVLREIFGPPRSMQPLELTRAL